MQKQMVMLFFYPLALPTPTSNFPLPRLGPLTALRQAGLPSVRRFSPAAVESEPSPQALDGSSPEPSLYRFGGLLKPHSSAVIKQSCGRPPRFDPSIYSTRRTCNRSNPHHSASLHNIPALCTNHIAPSGCSHLSGSSPFFSHLSGSSQFFPSKMQ